MCGQLLSKFSHYFVVAKALYVKYRGGELPPEKYPASLRRLITVPNDSYRPTNRLCQPSIDCVYEAFPRPQRYRDDDETDPPVVLVVRVTLHDSLLYTTGSAECVV